MVLEKSAPQEWYTERKKKAINPTALAQKELLINFSEQFNSLLANQCKTEILKLQHASSFSRLFLFPSLCHHAAGIMDGYIYSVYCSW